MAARRMISGLVAREIGVKPGAELLSQQAIHGPLAYGLAVRLPTPAARRDM